MNYYLIVKDSDTFTGNVKFFKDVKVNMAISIKPIFRDI